MDPTCDSNALLHFSPFPIRKGRGFFLFVIVFFCGVVFQDCVAVVQRYLGTAAVGNLSWCTSIRPLDGIDFPVGMGASSSS